MASGDTIYDRDLPLNIQSESVLNIADYQPTNSFERQLRNYKVKLAVTAVRENHGNKTVGSKPEVFPRAYLHRLLRLESKTCKIRLATLKASTWRWLERRAFASGGNRIF